MNVQLCSATSSDRVALDNLMQLYVHDFSEFWAGRAEGDLGEDGRFQAYPLEAYWRNPKYVPLLIRAEAKIAGFVLINDVSHSGRPVDRNMAEFFVARKYRRSGVGTLAAHLALTTYPGQWEVAVARKNTSALAFWRKVIRHHPLFCELDELDVASPAWNGPILRFRIRPAN